jgi:hypothetical protein
MEDSLKKTRDQWMEHNSLERGNAIKVIREAL